MDQLQYFPKKKSDQIHEDKTQDDNSHVDNSFMAVVEVQSTKYQMQTSNLANNSNDVQDYHRSMLSISFEENANENSQEEPSITCPYCQISLHNNVILKGHIDDISMTCIGKNYFLPSVWLYKLQIKTNLPSILSHGTKLHKLFKRVNPFLVHPLL